MSAPDKPLNVWQPIETIPNDVFVDVWVTSKTNPSWGVRLTNVCKSPRHSLGWVGIEKYYVSDDIHPVRWMIVSPPDDL